jgi:4-carboxymuconolactone decarboxylase
MGDAMSPEDVDPESRCRLPLPRREQLDDAGQRTYDSLADPKGGTIRGLKGPGVSCCKVPDLTTARELDSQFEWAAHEPEALSEGISQEIIELIKHRKDTSGLDEADAIVIEPGREIFGARKVASATFARSLCQFGRRALVDLVALMGDYAGTAALLNAFDMQLDPGQPPLLPP